MTGWFARPVALGLLAGLTALGTVTVLARSPAGQVRGCWRR